MQFVFDLDGTICFKGQPISDRLVRSLKELTDKGHEVIFASARPIRDMLPVIHEDLHHYTMIGGNGSLIYKNREVIYARAFSATEIASIRRIITECEATYLIDGEWDYAYTGPETHAILQNVDPGKLAQLVGVDELETIVKILLLTSNNFDRLATKLKELNVSIHTHRNENVLDISPKGIHKWSALLELGVQKGNYIAFGNDANDLTMFENALYTVMIGHHDQLVYYSKEAIALTEDVEKKIEEKIREILQKHL
ncbi:HAD-IIB family hydrolase [Psychrobacillus sp. NPDC058041]|uniref:HAD-IIB family hydrolase n=1 Tax=Psychrobacillus sp. NPDC058041 TaxID=3346310 RepID=UPI0036DC48BD